MRVINTTLRQKWFDFTHPTKVEHYGYHFSGDDMRQFPEGRMILCETKRRELNVRHIASMVSPLIKQMRRTLDKLVSQVITRD